jgi:diguanylate cyclase (GGDEF)-like protein
MADKEADLHAKLKALKEGYRKALPAKIEAINALWDKLSSGEVQDDVVEELHRQVHSLAGSGATFGMPSVSQSARNLEILLKSIIQSASAIDGDEKAQVVTLLDSLNDAAQEKASEDIPVSQFGSAMEASEPETDRHVLMIEDDVNLASWLSIQAGNFGFSVEAVNNLEDISEAITCKRPSIIISDISFPEGDLAGIDYIVKAIEEHHLEVPLIFLSSRNDLKARLQAVRAGCDAYFTKPVNISQLIDKLNELCSSQDEEPYRVLIVDDEQSLSEFFAAVVEQAGMSSFVVNHPMEVMEPLYDFQPDLILMDIHMPECSGIELARVIRQQPNLVSIPIVFLSSESDVEMQFTAMSEGGDDFLIKPIDPTTLVRSITIRARRSRLLRDQMIRDSLTGLFNHTRIKEQLEIEVARAQRSQEDFAFVMVDIDHFKSINDTYGHMTGDSVLKSLSQFFQRRLRQSDITGRYGGEEFAIILPDTSEQGALHIMEEMRKDFASVMHQADDTKFSVTFSCGVAMFSSFQDANKLNSEADKALYEAKESGRNRVCIAALPEG